MFSPLPGSSADSIITIEKLSSVNVLSYKDHSFTVESFWSLPASSSQSRPSDFESLEAAWQTAFKKMSEEDTKEGFPISIAALLSQPMSDSEEDELRSVSKHSMGLETPRPTEEWVPPPPDPTVNVPGEHVLSTTKTKGCKGKFYPAKIIAYIPPKTASTPPKYTVHFMDNAQEDVTRDMFYTFEQEEFGTCKVRIVIGTYMDSLRLFLIQLGVYESAESFYENDRDDDLEKDSSIDFTEFVVISGRPLLPVPAPEEFCGLTILEQFSYIIPILKKITENNYKPAEGRVTAFLSGGHRRAELSRQAPQRGTLTRREVNQLAHVIKHWALGLYPSSDEMRNLGTSTEVITQKRLEQASLSPPEPDAQQERASTPDDLIEKQVSSMSTAWWRSRQGVAL